MREWHFREYGQPVKPETHFRKRLTIPALRYHIYLKVVPFNLALSTILASTERNDAGRLIGVEGKTVDRARDGEVVSERFIANCVAAFKLHRDTLEAVGLQLSIDQFFEERLAPDFAELAEAVA